MKVELSKREIEVILDLMEAGVTFLTTHQWADKSVKEDKERMNKSCLPCSYGLSGRNRLKAQLREQVRILLCRRRQYRKGVEG